MRNLKLFDLLWLLLIVMLASCAHVGDLRETRPIFRPASLSPNATENSTVSANSADSRVVVAAAEESDTDNQVITAGAEQQALGLSALEQIALENNPTLAQAQAHVNAAYGQWTQVGLYPNPVVSYQGGEIGDNGNAGQQGAEVGQELVTAGKLQLNRHAASHEIERVGYQYEAQRYRVLTSVRKGFYDVLVRERTVELGEQLVKIGEKGVSDATALFQAQQVPQADVLQARVVENQARILLQNAQDRKTAAERQLEAIAGTPLPHPMRLSASKSDKDLLAGEFDWELEELNWEHTLSALTANSPELAAAYANVSRRRVEFRRAQVEPIPNLDVQTGALYDYDTRFAFAQVQVGVSLPLFDRNEGNIQTAQAELIAAQREVERVGRDLESRLARAMERYSSARYEVQRYSKQILKDAKQALDLVTQGYPNQFGSVRLLATQRTYFQTNIAYLQALQEWWTAKMEIEGLLLTNGLEVSQ